MIRAMI